MKLSIWAASPLQRVFPWTAKSRGQVRLLVARGERASFQVAFRHDSEKPVSVSASAEAGGPISVTVREVGLVPVPHANTDTPAEESDLLGRTPCYVPDPLLTGAEILQEANVTRSFWITVIVPADARPSASKVTVTVLADGKKAGQVVVPVTISRAVCDLSVNPLITHWFYADSLCDWYRVKPFDEAFWPIFDAYVRNYVEHGSNTLYVPAFTPPLDGIKRPTQLLRVKKSGRNRYQFDWRDVETWVGRAQAAGVRRFEWSHLFTQWGCANAIRIYQGDPNAERLLWDPKLPATDPVYREFLGQYTGELEQFLKRQRLMDSSVFHISDEPGIDHRPNYRAAREMMREIAPWMRFMDALSNVEFALDGVVDEPVASIAHVHEFREKKVPCLAYFCCGPRGAYLNRLLDTPLAKIRMTGWMLHRMQVLGFLHWGYNYWYKSQTRQMIDPYVVSDALRWPGWAHGDPFVVYPGENGAPVDSIRWEVFAESMQDYALLRGLQVDPAGALLRRIRSFSDFPKDPTWLGTSRAKLLGT